MKFWIVSIFIPFIHLAQLSEQVILSTNWQFKNSAGPNWQQAKVPGNVYNDLFEAKQIPDPYFSSNEKKCSGLIHVNGIIQPNLTSMRLN